MSRVTLSFFAAAAVSLAAAGSAQAGCGCNAGYGYATQSVVVQPAPQLVAIQPAPVVVAVQPAPIVQQYVVNQGPLYAGPMLTDYNPAIYYAPSAVGPSPYVSGYRKAHYAPRPHHHPYRGYPPIRRAY